MGGKLLAALVLATLVLAACEPYGGPTASCFNLVAGPGGCDFRPLPGPDEAGGGA